MNLFHQRLAVVATLAASALALAAGAAAADNVSRPDDRATHGPGAIAASQPSDPVRPDDRADRRLPNTSVEAQPTTAGRFDWIDAGIGATAAFGMVLLVAGALLVGLRQRRTAALP
jgi:hypothetical protein